MPGIDGWFRRDRSLDEAAKRITRILEQEDADEALRRWQGRMAPAARPAEAAQAKRIAYPIGSLDWAGEKIQRMIDREKGVPPAAGVPLAMPEHRGESLPDAIRRSIDAQTAAHEEHVAVDAARSEAVSAQLPGRANGPADAYRHIVWAAEMTRRFGEDRAREILELHEQSGLAQGRPADESAVDSGNNEIGIAIGRFARDFDDVVSAARKAISGSAPDGGGAWKPDYDPTSTLAPHAARWLPEDRWATNPQFEPPHAPGEMTTSQTNWYTNPNRPQGPDWERGYVPDGYRYPYGEPQHATGPNDMTAARAANAYWLGVKKQEWKKYWDDLLSF